MKMKNEFILVRMVVCLVLFKKNIFGFHRFSEATVGTRGLWREEEVVYLLGFLIFALVDKHKYLTLQLCPSSPTANPARTSMFCRQPWMTWKQAEIMVDWVKDSEMSLQ